MIRVLVDSERLESVIRANPSFEFTGRVDPYHLAQSDLTGDVLVVEIENSNDQDWAALANLPIPVIALLDSSLASPALRAGIRGAISWDATPEEIQAAVQAVNAGLVVTMPDAQPFAEEFVEPLTGRELEVLDLVAEGLSNKLIAHRLGISEHTVKTHVASIFAKLGASSRTEAVSRAIRRGLVML